MFEIVGRYTSAKIYSDICDPEATSQIYNLCNHPVFEGAVIRIMPDVHAGAGCTVGTTIHMLGGAVIPSIVGADIGCGVLSVVFECGGIDFKALDDFILNNLPSGMAIRKSIHPHLSRKVRDEIDAIVDDLKMYKSRDAFHRTVGSLGGGNHYIEIGMLDTGAYMLSIHSGSRAVGKCVAEYFTDRAKEYVSSNRLTGFDRSMPFLKEEGYEAYIIQMLRSQSVAAENRRLIALDIINFLGGRVTERFDTVHNYVELHRDSRITIRKGAVSAKSGERLAIPVNMRDGVLICEGLGNEEWNSSAPHGAGRLMSRREAKDRLSMDDYVSSMIGVKSWSVLPETIDESPMAYKPIGHLLEQVDPTVKVISTAHPLYNFKARSIAGN